MYAFIRAVGWAQAAHFVVLIVETLVAIAFLSAVEPAWDNEDDPRAAMRAATSSERNRT